MGDSYNSGNIPHGCFVETVFDKDGNELGQYTFENININRSDNIVNRPAKDSGPNGWAATPTQIVGSATMQIPEADSEWPASGSYFEDDLGYGSERFVILSPQQAFPMNGYWTQAVTLQLDPEKANSA